MAKANTKARSRRPNLPMLVVRGVEALGPSTPVLRFSEAQALNAALPRAARCNRYFIYDLSFPKAVSKHDSG
jgi:hypothetical protein